MSSPLFVTDSIPVTRMPLEIADQTRAIQTAIDEAAARGGGTVRVGEGTWTVTTLVLKSGVDLHLEHGAVLQAAHDLSQYPSFERFHRPGKEHQHCYHLIVATDCENISITGRGTIDGQDTAFWKPCETEDQRLYGIFDFTVPGRRPSPLIQIVRCRRVRVEGVTIRRAPGWTLHCFDCDDVHIRRVRIRNHLLGPNTDGIGITDSRDVIISGCDLTCGDDTIIIKSTHPDKSCERIIVSDCIAESNCAAFGIGAEVAGAIRDVVFSNCVARASLRMIQIQLWLPGVVENVIFSNITGKTFPSPGVFCERPISVDIQQFKRPEPILGAVRNIQFSNVLCTTRGRIIMTAQDGAKIENVTLRDVHLDIPEIEDPEDVVPKSRSMQMSNFNPETRAARAAAIFDNVDGLRVAGLTVRWPARPSVPMSALVLRNVSEAEIDAPRLAASEPGVEKFRLINSTISGRQ